MVIKMFKPTLRLKNVLSIDKKLLYKIKVRGLILDLDNTLSMDGSPAAEIGVTEWLDEMRRLGIKLIILSNNTARRVSPLASELGVDYISFGCKPLPFGVRKAAKKLQNADVPRAQIAIVGDQIFTDIAGANLYGIKSILVEPFHMEGNWTFRLRRKLESAFFSRDFTGKGSP
ncbi:MAG: YqeG family HAD IIIA-type phosphatase [Oscillospiraceae bacterium]|nr:YqeG family HAD IIIA-type phosphatase [Oscillospiraceae bacterium]